jgi:uncharacterized protein (DUF433 family)
MRSPWLFSRARLAQWYTGDDTRRTVEVTMPSYLDRITIDPAICHGKPCIRGLRYPVSLILELLSAGMSPGEILADYEDLEHEDIIAALEFAARVSRVKRIQPIAA